MDPWPVPQGPDYLLGKEREEGCQVRPYLHFLFVIACCKQEGILPECMSVCTENIDINVYEQNTRCIDEFPKLMACTNGKLQYYISAFCDMNTFREGFF